MEDKLKACLDRMIGAYRDLEEAKQECKEQIELARAGYEASLEFGDEIIPEKTMKKMAEAMAKGKLEKVGLEAAEFIKAVKTATGEILPGMEEAA